MGIHTHTRVYSRKNHPHRAHLNSHAQRQHLCSLRTRKTHHKVKKMSFSTTFTGAKIAQKSIVQKQSVDKQISARRTKASSPSTQRRPKSPPSVRWRRRICTRNLVPTRAGVTP